MDDMLKEVPTIVDLCRTVDRDKAISLVAQLVRTSFSAGQVDAARALAQALFGPKEAA